MKLEIKKPTHDGRVETFAPHKYSDGYYRVEVRVKTLEEVEKLAAEGCAVRVKGDVNGKVNLSKLV